MNKLLCTHDMKIIVFGNIIKDIRLILSYEIFYLTLQVMILNTIKI
jgi:hypothetical protein